MSGPDRIITIIDSIPQPWRRIIVVLMDERDKAKAVLENRESLAALPEVQSLIAGAFEAAAKLALPEERGSQVDPTEFSAGCRHNGLRLNAAIRAMTPADAIAARDALIAEAVAKEREACAGLATSFLVGDPRNGIPLRFPSGIEVAAAIRKRGEGQP